MKFKLLHEADVKRTFAVILQTDAKRCVASRNSQRRSGSVARR